MIAEIKIDIEDKKDEKLVARMIYGSIPSVNATTADIGSLLRNFISSNDHNEIRIIILKEGNDKKSEIRDKMTIQISEFLKFAEAVKLIRGDENDY